MFKLAPLIVIALCGLSNANTSEQQSTTDTTDLNKFKSGEKNVAASGQLDPFGQIGVGCGINWKENQSYGGGLQAGSKDFGLGGGFTIKPDSFEIGAGVGLNPTNQTANIQFSASKNGTFEFVFESSQNFACTPGTKDGKYNIRCTTM